MIVVSDTSAITSLLQIGEARLLRELYGEVLVPEAVRKELLRWHRSLPDFLRCESVSSVAEVQRLLSQLDVGEAEAIVLAKERKADLLLVDEVEARRVALREGLPFIGLLGVLVHAKRRGCILSVGRMVAELERVAGFRVSEQIKGLVLKRAGEA